MADTTPYPDSGSHATADDTGVGPALGSTTGPPRWVKVFGIIALVAVVLVGVLLLAGGGPGGHGPGRHTGNQTQPSSAMEPDRVGGRTLPSSVSVSGGVGGHRPPAGAHAP